ncbi:MAG: glycerophosphodiester phosphodiesterase [Muribaculaceae bacterium]|nr:glycerophosphodiester phosphodiesterase [Muribaculaceae bacterium]
MFKNLIRMGVASLALVALATSCSEEQQFTSEKTDAKRVEVQVLNADLAKVRDYVPLYAVIAHRGSTFWAPEETEASWRWAREMGADYLESDVQCTKDGIVLANHDENLKRTTNIENIFSETVPTTRVDFYMSLGFSKADAEAQYGRDIASFRPFYTLSYYYAELLMLDSGSWFNETSLEQSRPSFAATQNGYFDKGTNKIVYSNGLYISAIQDQIAYAEGKRLVRDANGRRVLTYKIKDEYKGMTLQQIYEAIKAKGQYNAKYMDFIEYDFDHAYEADPEDTGNRPGIYVEFKESWLNPGNMEQRVYDVLTECGWNIIEKPATETAFYKAGKVNVGNTNGKVILQTFSFDALRRANDIFKGRVPMCYLLWISEPAYATDIAIDDPTGYAAFIKWAQDNGAHIIGPAISGAPNNYPEMNAPWQAYMIRKSGMINHPYSFDSWAQMCKYMGYYNYGLETEFDDLLRLEIPSTPYTTTSYPNSVPVYMDGFFTNRTEMSLRYMIENGFRGNPKLPNPFHAGQVYDNSAANVTVPDAVETLVRLGY